MSYELGTRETGMFAGTPTMWHTRTQTHCAHFFIIRTVTGETFRWEKRGALYNECAEPCYMAEEPLKWHNLLPPLSQDHQCADTKTEIKVCVRDGGSAKKKKGRWKHLANYNFYEYFRSGVLPFFFPDQNHKKISRKSDLDGRHLLHNSHAVNCLMKRWS